MGIKKEKLEQRRRILHEAEESLEIAQEKLKIAQAHQGSIEMHFAIKKYLEKHQKTQRNMFSSKKPTKQLIDNVINSSNSEHGSKKKSTNDYLLSKLEVLRFEQNNEDIDNFITNNQELIGKVINRLLLEDKNTKGS